MPTETVQIGPFLISKVAFDVIMPFLAGLAGALFVAIFSYLSGKRLEDTKHRRELEKEFQTDQREAIGLAIETLRPLNGAALRMKFFTELFKQKKMFENALFHEDKLREEYAKVLTYLKDFDKLQLPKGKHHALLGEDFGTEVGLLSVELFKFSLVDKGILKIDDVIPVVDDVLNRLTKLSTTLTKLYRKSYGVRDVDKMITGTRFTEEKHLKKMREEQTFPSEPEPLISTDLHLKIQCSLISLKKAGSQIVEENWETICNVAHKADDAAKGALNAWQNISRDNNPKNQAELDQALRALRDLLAQLLRFIPRDDPNHATLALELKKIINAEELKTSGGRLG